MRGSGHHLGEQVHEGVAEVGGHRLLGAGLARRRTRLKWGRLLLSGRDVTQQFDERVVLMLCGCLSLGLLVVKDKAGYMCYRTSYHNVMSNINH